MNRMLLVILLFAGLARLALLNLMPPSLNWDEVSHGYNAYSILKTGRDEWGELFPTIFRAYGDYKLPVYIYTTVPFVAIFGLNEFSVRLPSVIAGTLTVLFTYLLVSKLFRKAGPALATLSALFVAIEPWGFFLSRVAVEANLVLFLIITGVWCVVSGWGKRWRLLIGILLLGLSVWTYNSARVFIPLLLIFLAIIYKNELVGIWKKDKRTIAYCLLPIAFFFIPMFYQLANPQGQARYGAVQILDEGAIAQINASRTGSNLPEPLPILLHNKMTYFAGAFTKNYLSHFSPDFLFFRGGTNYQFNIPGKGLIYSSEMLFIVIGLVWMIKQRTRASWLILAWLLLAPVASSLTREAPHTLRSIVMMPIPQILAAVGLIVGWEWINKFKVKSEADPSGTKLKVILAGVYIVLLLYFVEAYAREYVGPYRTNYSWSWQYGYREAVQFIKENYNKYDQIIMTKKYGEPHEFVLFYMNWSPEKYKNDPNLIRFEKSNWFWVDRFDKFYFVNDWQVPRMEDSVWRMESDGVVPTISRALLITSPGNYPPGWKLLQTINFLDSKPVFDILEKI